jgi:hypothetical protein
MASNCARMSPSFGTNFTSPAKSTSGRTTSPTGEGPTSSPSNSRPSGKLATPVETSRRTRTKTMTTTPNAMHPGTRVLSRGRTLRRPRKNTGIGNECTLFIVLLNVHFAGNASMCLLVCSALLDNDEAILLHK